MRVATPGAVWIDKRKTKRGRTTYRLRWVDPDTGRKRSQAAGRDSAVARMMAGERARELRGLAAGEALPRRLSELVACLPGWMSGRSATSLRNAKTAILGVIAQCGDLKIGALTRERVMAFRAARLAKYSRATVNRDLRHLKAALSLAVDAGWLPSNKLLRWKKLFVNEPEKVVRVVEADELAKLLALTGPDQELPAPGMALAIMLAYYQGLRREEVVKLRWADVDLKRRALTVANIIGEAGERDILNKSRRNRTVPLREAVVTALEQAWKDAPKMVRAGKRRPKIEQVVLNPLGKPYGKDELTHRFAKLVASAGVKRCVFHDLRRSFSTLAQRAGLDPSTVMILGGWSSLAVMQRHYTGEIGQHFRAAMEFLDRKEAAGA